MTESDLYREIFYLARKNLAIAFKVINNLSWESFNFVPLEKYYSSRDRNELALLREMISRIDPKTVTKDYLIKSACTSKSVRAQNFYASTAVELFLKELSIKEILNISPYFSGFDYINKVEKELIVRQKDIITFEDLISYQHSGEKIIRELSKTLILSIPKEFLKKDSLMSMQKMNYSMQEIALELLLIHFEEDLDNDFIMESIKFSNKEIFLKAKVILEKRFLENKLSKNFIDKYLNSKNSEQLEQAVNFSIKRKLDEKEQREFNDFCSECIF